MSDLSDTLSLQLEELKRRYRADLRHHVGDLATTWEQACAAADMAPGLDVLRDQVHRLAGTSGIFGLRDVSRAAFAMEDILDRHDGTLPLSTEDRRTLDQLVQSLRDMAIACRAT